MYIHHRVAGPDPKSVAKDIPDCRLLFHLPNLEQVLQDIYAWIRRALQGVWHNCVRPRTHAACLSGSTFADCISRKRVRLWIRVTVRLSSSSTRTMQPVLYVYHSRWGVHQYRTLGHCIESLVATEKELETTTSNRMWDPH